MDNESEANIPGAFHVGRDETFCQELLTSLHSLQQSHTLTDFTIRVGDRSFACHKLVLMAMCPYFDAMVRSGLEEVRNSEVHLESLHEEVVEALIEYFYTGKITIDYRNIKDLVEACEFLQCMPLKAKCEAYITGQVSERNVISWYKFASMYSLTEVTSKAKEVMHSSFTKVSLEKEFLELPLAELLDYIKDDELKIDSEDPVFSACLRWVRHDELNRKEELDHIIDHIRMEYCSQDLLESITGENSALLDTLKIQKRLVKALLHARQPQVAGLGTHTCRVGYSAKLPKLVVVGGYSTLHEASNQHCWAMTSDHNWIKFSAIKNPLEMSSACRVSSGLVVTGGTEQRANQGNDYKCFKVAWYYSENVDAWIALPPTNSPRYAHSMLSCSDTVYVFGGLTTVNSEPGTYETPLETVECLKLGEKKWKYVAPMIHKSSYPLAAKVDSSFYLILNTWRPGWLDIDTVLRNHGISLQCYDIADDTWSMKSPMPDAVESTGKATAIGTKDSIFVIGGDKNVCVQYRVMNDTWTILKPCSTLHHHGAAVLYQNRIILLGGKNDTVEEYDINKDEWKLVPWKLPLYLHCHFACFMKVKH